MQNDALSMAALLKLHFSGLAGLCRLGFRVAAMDIEFHPSMNIVSPAEFASPALGVKGLGVRG